MAVLELSIVSHSLPQQMVLPEIFSFIFRDANSVALWKAVSVDWSAHHFGWDWKISTSISLFASKDSHSF